MRHRSLGITLAAFVLYVAVVIWQAVAGEGQASVISFMTGNTLNAILIAALILCIVLMLGLPYWQTRSILKTVPGGVLKANYYFYEKTFQYGWGSSFDTIAYMNIEEFISLEKTFYIKADNVSYWIKKEDFVVGTADEFYKFMCDKVTCKVLHK